MEFKRKIQVAAISLIGFAVITHAWEGEIYQFRDYEGRSAIVGGDSNDCVSLKDELLCYSDSDDCRPAYNAVSSIRLRYGQCVKAYRDLHCVGEPDAILKRNGKCHKSFCSGLFCPDNCKIDNTIGSLSSCDYTPKCSQKFKNTDWYRNRFGNKRRDNNTTTSLHPLVQRHLKRNKRQEPFTTRVEHLAHGDVVVIDSLPADNLHLGRQVMIPIYVDAVITSPPAPYAHTGFENLDWAAERMQELQALPGDQRGHLIAASLSGVIEDWNLVPQTVALNDGNGYFLNWRTIENSQVYHLQQAACNFIKWSLVIDYELLNTRPSLFNLIVEYWSTDHDGNEFLVYDDDVQCNNVNRNVVCTSI